MDEPKTRLRGIAQVRSELKVLMQEGDIKTSRKLNQKNIKLVAAAIEHELVLLTALLAELIKNNGG